MRILYFFMVACLVLTFGCAGMKAERTVLQDNVFYSSTSPKLKIKIHSDFRYIGKAERLKWSEGVEKTATTHFQGESYLFGHIEDDKILKGVVIRIFTLGDTHWYWLPDLFPGVKDKLDSGVVKIKGENYQHVVAPFSRLFSKDEAAFISDKGYIIPSCFLVKGLGRIVSADERTKMYIFYIEDIRHIHGNKYSCRDWINKNMLRNEQQELLKGFIDRSQKNFQILGRKEVTFSREGKESLKAATRETAPPAAREYLAEPYRVMFSTMLTEGKNRKPMNDLTEISINEKRVYIFVQWRLSLEEHDYNSKIFDGSGKLVYEGQMKFKPTKTSWNTWTYYGINKHVDKPGRWKFEIHLDGRKIVEQYLTVLPQ